MTDQEQPEPLQESQGQVVVGSEATQEEIDNALTLKQVHERTGLSMVYIRRRITTGKWRAFKDDKGRNRILVREVEAWEAWREIADTKAADRKVAAKEKAKAKVAKAAAKAKAEKDAEAAAKDPSGIAAEL